MSRDFFCFFNQGCLTAPPGYEYGAFQAHKEPFSFFTWMPDGASGYEYGAFQAHKEPVSFFTWMPDGAPGYEYGAFQAHKESFSFFTWMPNGAPGYEYGAFQALVIAQAEGERQRTLTLSIYGEGAA